MMEPLKKDAPVADEVLWAISCEAPLVEKIVGHLQQRGLEGLASRLDQLHTDAGNQYATGDGWIEKNEAQTPVTVHAQYQPVTVQRLQGLLGPVYDALEDRTLKGELAQAMQTWRLVRLFPESGIQNER